MISSSRLGPGFVALVGAAGLVVVLVGLRTVQSIAGPFFLALVLTVAVGPLRNRLMRRGAPGWVCAAVPLLVILLVLAALGLALAVSAAKLAALVPEYADEAQALTDDLARQLTRFGVTGDEAGKWLSSVDLTQFIPVLQKFLTGVLGAMSAVLLIIILLYGMSMDAVGLRRALDRLAGERPALVGALEGYASDTYRYLVVSTVFGLIVAVLDVIALALLGVPLALLWGLLAFITNYIPNVGFVIGLAPPALLALLDSGPATALWVVVVYSVLNFVIQSLIQPKFVGDAAGLSVTVTLVSLAVWTFVLGPIGAILAVPLTSLLRALLLDTDPDKKWVTRLLSGSPG